MTIELSEALTEDFDGRTSIVSECKTVDDLAKSYAALRSKQGRMVTLPGETATDEDHAKFRKHFGIPDSPDAYSVPENAPDLLKELRSHAHSSGMSSKGWEKLSTSLSESLSNHSKALTESLESTAQEWAQANKAKLGDKADEVKGVVRNAVNKLWGSNQAVLDVLEKSGIGSESAFVQALYDIGKNMLDDKTPDNTGGGTTGLSEAELRDKIQKTWSALQDPNRKAEHETLKMDLMAAYKEFDERFPDSKSALDAPKSHTTLGL